MTFWQKKVAPPRSEPVDYSYLSNETREQATERLQDLERRAQATRTEILKAYLLTPEPNLALEPSGELKGRIIHMSRIAANSWKPKEPERFDTPEIRDIIAECGNDYLNAFYLLKKLNEEPQVRRGYERYHPPQARNILYGMHINHLTNATEARLMANGVDFLNAHRINGYIVRHAIDAAKDIMGFEPHVYPRPKPPKNEPDVVEQIHFQRNCGEGLSTMLNNALNGELTR